MDSGGKMQRRVSAPDGGDCGDARKESNRNRPAHLYYASLPRNFESAQEAEISAVREMLLKKRNKMSEGRSSFADVQENDTSSTEENHEVAKPKTFRVRTLDERIAIKKKMANEPAPMITLLSMQKDSISYPPDSEVLAPKQGQEQVHQLNESICLPPESEAYSDLTPTQVSTDPEKQMHELPQVTKLSYEERIRMKCKLFSDNAVTGNPTKTPDITSPARCGESSMPKQEVVQASQLSYEERIRRKQLGENATREPTETEAQKAHDSFQERLRRKLASDEATEPRAVPFHDNKGSKAVNEPSNTRNAELLKEPRAMPKQEVEHASQLSYEERIRRKKLGENATREPTETEAQNAHDSFQERLRRKLASDEATKPRAVQFNNNKESRAVNESSNTRNAELLKGPRGKVIGVESWRCGKCTYVNIHPATYMKINTSKQCEICQATEINIE